MAPVTVNAIMGPGEIDDKIPVGAWVLQRNTVDKNGKVFDSFDINDMPPQCQEIIRQAMSGKGAFHIKGTENGDPIDDCLNKAGYRQIAKYQPRYRYWDFQRIETGIYLGMTAVAVGVTYWLVLKRDA
jgi:hypothetical protein